MLPSSASVQAAPAPGEGVAARLALRVPRSVGGLGETEAVPPTRSLKRLLGDRADLAGRLAAALVVEQGRRRGDPETRVTLDHRIPDPAAASGSPRARWRLATSAARLYPPPVSRQPLSAWHDADGPKGRRLLAADLANDNRVAALLAWHFEPDTSSRPHLVTAAAVRAGVDAAVEAEYVVGLWLLVCVAAAIDRRTIQRGRVGLVRDSAIDVDLADLKLLGFRRGRKADGDDGDYYVFEA